jgi:3-methylcrotonyl-CoA carboxylase alpha subunit
MFERECSIQRRHQKIVEESPSPTITPELRRTMGETAVAAAKAIGYANAGTVEFLVDEDDAFYFLEVNTRLQVEHPVTELTVMEDLVRLQVLVAAGEPLPVRQEDIVQQGHVIETRIYAEDPARNFMPSTGVIACYREPHGRAVRVDSGVGAGTEVSVHYDPMLAKLIVWGHDRAEAMQRMRWALRRYVVLGVTTNIDFLANVIEHPEFIAGRTHTKFIEDHELLKHAAAPVDDPTALIAAAFAVKNGTRSHAAGSNLIPSEGILPGGAGGPWSVSQRWRGA